LAQATHGRGHRAAGSMEAPLLSRSALPSGPGSALSRAPCTTIDQHVESGVIGGQERELPAGVPPSRWVRGIRRWWRLTTDGCFLQSPRSRRHLWTCGLPSVALAGALHKVTFHSDVQLKWGHEALVETGALALSAAIFFACLARLPRGRLWADVVLTIAAAGYLSLLAAMHRVEPNGQPAMLILWTACLGILGINSLVVLSFCCTVLALEYVASQSGTGANVDVVSAVACVGLTFGIGYVEYQTALLCCMLQESQRATQALFDSCSDGFCTFDGVTGRIVNASAKLHKLLDKPEQLDQFSRDEQVQRVVKRALQDGELVPTVTELRLPTSTGCGSTDLRMRLVPYAVGEGQVSLCVQLQETSAVISALSMEGFTPMHPCTSRAVEAYPPLAGGKRLVPAELLAPAAPQPEANSASLGCKKDQATETSISWERDGFVCKSCSSARPPRPHAAPRPGPPSSVRSGGSRRSRGMRQITSSNLSMGQAISSAASSASWESRPGICAEPLISHFAPTSAWSAAVSLLCVMVTWNLPRLPGYCCPFHMAVATAKLLLRRVSKQHCNPLWSPLTGWQCSHCTCMNRDGKEVCEQCGAKNDAFVSTAASGSPASQYAPAVPLAQGPAGSSIHGHAADIGVVSVAGEPNLFSGAAFEAYLQQAIGSACSSALDSAALDGSAWLTDGHLSQGVPEKMTL